jgi:peptide chain release factor subunit 1
MTELERTLVRKLAEWSPGESPVTTVYLSVDGKLFPRKQDYEVRVEDLLRHAHAAAEGLPKPQRLSVERDIEEMRSFVGDRFDRGARRGLAMFSSSAAGLWEDIEVPWSVRNQEMVGPYADLLQLEAMLEAYESFCTVLVDSEKARIFLAELGRIEEQSHLLDDVPGRHEQGGWAQARYQRHVDDHRQRHFKHTAEVLFGFFKRRPFDHLIVGGPEEPLVEFESELHDYLKQRILARINAPITASAAEVLDRSLRIEEDLGRTRVREAIERIVAEGAAGRHDAVAGLEPTLAALFENRVQTLIVSLDLRAPGRECPQCERLTARGKKCPACRSQTHEVPDVVEAAVRQALRHGARAETVTEDGDFAGIGGIGALLRF